MKKYLYKIVLATLILMSTTVVNAANEVYYVNKNNIEMTEEEYNSLQSLGFTEKYINRMEKEEFLANKDLDATLLSTSKKYVKVTTMMRNGIEITTSSEITEEEYNELQENIVPNRGPSGNFYDGMVVVGSFTMTASIAAIGNIYMRYMNNVEWSSDLANKHHDIIGIGIEYNKVQLASVAVLNEHWDATDGSSGGTGVCAPKYVGSGALAVFELPSVPVQYVDVAFYFNVRKQSNVGTITSLYAVGDYAHASSDVTPSNLLSHISISDTTGITIDSTYSAYFTNMPEATASFIGTW